MPIPFGTTELGATWPGASRPIDPLAQHVAPRRWAGVAAAAAAWFAILLRVALALGEVPEGRSAPAPFFDARQRQTEYAGPGRELPEPSDIAEVRLGYFGPAENDPELGDAFRAAQLAIEELNQQGGYRGKPFRLVPGWSDQPWKDGARQVTRMVYGHEVWAVIGGPDGATTHLAEQVVAKARLPLVSPGSTDRTANLANVPWMFSLLPGDHLQAPLLVEHMVGRLGSRPVAILSAEDHDARQFVMEFRRAANRARLQPARLYVCSSRETMAEAAAKLVETEAAGVVVAGSPTASAAMVTALRRAGYRGAIFGSASMGRRSFLQHAGDQARGCVFPLLYVPGSEGPDGFAARFQKRYGYEPDYLAAATYDAVQLLAAAVRRAGLNRARIGDALWALSPWRGVCGIVRWDKLGSNARVPTLGSLRAGRLVPWESEGASDRPHHTPTPRPSSPGPPDRKVAEPGGGS